MSKPFIKQVDASYKHEPRILNELASHRHILLLQGPIGWFFSHLADFLEQQGCKVSKINFNGGDDLFYHRKLTYRYRQAKEEWAAWFTRFMRLHNINAIVLFGQWRYYHEIANEIAKHHGVIVYVFEEGYIRPDYVTLERYGVNGKSLISKNANYYRNKPLHSVPPPKHVGSRFFKVAGLAVLYYLAMSALSLAYPHYHHHRPPNPLSEGAAWLRSLVKKPYYQIIEQGIIRRLASQQMHKQYFLVPLQVHNDSQVHKHSKYPNVESFIREVTESFSNFCPVNYTLVFKHHPLDRGYRDYTKLIRELGQQHQIGGRILYVHDGHLPTLLEHAQGTITINSTVGLSSLHQGIPVKLMGEAVYDISGMVNSGELNSFWWHVGCVDHDLVKRFTNELIIATQLNAGFYTRTSFPYIFKKSGTMTAEDIK